MNDLAVVRIARVRWAARIAAVAGFGSCLTALTVARAHVFEAYWMAWIFWSSLGFGCLVIVMLHALTGGAWGDAIRPIAAAGAMTLPLAALLLVPAFFGLADIFPWAHAGAFHGRDWPHKRAYLSGGWFVVRSGGYFAVLAGLAWALGLWMRLPNSRPTFGAMSAGGLVAYFVVMLFASSDWIVSLEPQWFSTMFVVIFATDQFLSALALSVVVVTSLPRVEPLTAKQLSDLGNLLLAFVIFWAYVTFSQFLIIWSGNLPREISWYVHRSSGGWPAVAIVLAVFQFAVPFALLLLRITKRNARSLGPVAALILFASLVHVWWLIAPSFQTTGIHLSFLELGAFAGVGGVWVAVFLGCLKRTLISMPSSGEEVAHA